jgi:hypothetical protein
MKAAAHRPHYTSEAFAVASKQLVFGCLIGLGVSLLFVGVVSGTLLRHFVQILPILFAVAAVNRRPHWGANASIPIFLFWFVIVVLIWLFLLGLSTMATGHYTLIEKVLTAFMAVFSVTGVSACVRLGRPLRLARRAVPFAVFAVMQISAMWASFLPPLANR